MIREIEDRVPPKGEAWASPCPVTLPSAAGYAVRTPRNAVAGSAAACVPLLPAPALLSATDRPAPCPAPAGPGCGRPNHTGYARAAAGPRSLPAAVAILAQVPPDPGRRRYGCWDAWPGRHRHAGQSAQVRPPDRRPSA